MSWTSQRENSLVFSIEELLVSRKYLWSEGGKRQLLSFIGARPGNRVLDVGCGVGFLIETIAEATGDGEFAGVDIDGTLIAYAQQNSRNQVRYAVGSAYDLPFDGDSFDLVTAEFVMSNLNRPLEALKEMVRVTRKGGKVVCVDPPTAGRLFYSPSVPDDIQAIEHAVHNAVADRCARQGVDKSIGIRLPELFMKAGLSHIRAEGCLNLKLECQVETPEAAAERARDQLLMLRRQRRRLETAVKEGSITAEQSERYLAFWERRRAAVIEDPNLALADPSCNASTCMLVSGLK